MKRNRDMLGKEINRVENNNNAQEEALERVVKLEIEKNNEIFAIQKE